MYFLDDEHLEGFLKLVSTYRKERSREYVAAYYLLTYDRELRLKVLESISFQNGSIEWPALLKNSISNESKLIILLAFTLFNQTDRVNLQELGSSTTEETYRLMTQSLDIRKNWPRCF